MLLRKQGPGRTRPGVCPGTRLLGHLPRTVLAPEHTELLPMEPEKRQVVLNGSLLSSQKEKGCQNTSCLCPSLNLPVLPTSFALSGH